MIDCRFIAETAARFCGAASDATQCGGIRRIPLEVVPLEVVPSTLVSAHGTLRLASERALSFYDATYVMLAEMLDCPLMTADARLARGMRGTGNVRLLKRGALPNGGRP